MASSFNRFPSASLLLHTDGSSLREKLDFRKIIKKIEESSKKIEPIWDNFPSPSFFCQIPLGWTHQVAGLTLTYLLGVSLPFGFHFVCLELLCLALARVKNGKQT